MWVEFVLGSRPCSKGFSSGSPAYPPSTKINTSKFKFDLETVDEEPLHGKFPSFSLFLIIYFVEACVFDPLQDLLSVHAAVTLQLANATAKGKCSTLNILQTKITHSHTFIHYCDKEIKDPSNSLIVPECHYLMFKTIYCLLMVTIPVVMKQL